MGEQRPDLKLETFHEAIAVSAQPQKPVSSQVGKGITVTGTLSESSRNKEPEWEIEIQISTLTTGTVTRIRDGGDFGGQQHKCLRSSNARRRQCMLQMTATGDFNNLA